MFNLYYNAFKKELMNIVLIGYMGSGKSFIGSHLAKKINYKYIDLDKYIETNEGCSISKIFDDSGDIYFRKIETKYLIKCLSENNNFVLSLGGGTPCYNDNFKFINSINYKDFNNLLANSKGNIGNSSSGILEAPSLKIPTINIGFMLLEFLQSFILLSSFLFGKFFNQ